MKQKSIFIIVKPWFIYVNFLIRYDRKYSVYRNHQLR